MKKLKKTKNIRYRICSEFNSTQTNDDFHQMPTYSIDAKSYVSGFD